MTAVAYLDNAYVWWIVLEAVFAVIGSVTLAYTLGKHSLI